MLLIDFAHINNDGLTYAKARHLMVEKLSIKNSDLKQVMANTPRHYFIDQKLAARAYDNTALPIGFSQSISQPQVVVEMTESLIKHSKQCNSVLEIGTGCGYQTVILAQLFKEVYSIERIAALHKKAKQRFQKLHINNIYSFISDGSNLSAQTFDAILFTAAPEIIPQRINNLLNKDGCLIAPEGKQTDSAQQLIKIVFDGKNYKRSTIGWVHFVPFLAGVSL